MEDKYLNDKLYNLYPNTRGSQGYTSNRSIFTRVYYKKEFRRESSQDSSKMTSTWKISYITCIQVLRDHNDIHLINHFSRVYYEKDFRCKSSQDSSNTTSTRKASYTTCIKVLRDHRDIHPINPFSSVNETIWIWLHHHVLKGWQIFKR